MLNLYKVIVSEMIFGLNTWFNILTLCVSMPVISGVIIWVFIL